MNTESIKLEYKREYTEGINKTIVAFANTEGGNILIGIEDTGRVVGITDVDDTLLRITNSINTSIKPDVTSFVDIESLVMDGKQLVKVVVNSGTGKPYFLAKKGLRPEGVYIRHGSASIPASDNAIWRMVSDNSPESYEEALSLNQDLIFRSAEIEFKNADIPFGERQKQSLGMVRADHTFSNTGLLMSEQCKHTIKLALFEGSKKSRFLDRKEIGGSLLVHYEEARAWLARRNNVRSTLSGMERVDHFDYPPEAIREALLNAIVHRDYSYRDSTIISMFEDRLEIVSLGGLPKTATKESALKGISIHRNPKLANIFYRLHLVESFGTGINKIYDLYENFPRQPKFEILDNAFKVVLPNINYEEIHESSNGRTRDERTEEILQLFNESDRITRVDVENLLGVSQSQASLILKRMDDGGVVSKSGSGPNTYYVRSDFA